MKHVKLSAADRPQFRRDLAKMLQEVGCAVAEISPDAVILCKRAEDFHHSENAVWELEANKSVVRPDVVCSWCKSIVVLSNHAYGRYALLDRKPRVCCSRCVESLAGL